MKWDYCPSRPMKSGEFPHNFSVIQRLVIEAQFLLNVIEMFLVKQPHHMIHLWKCSTDMPKSDRHGNQPRRDSQRAILTLC